MSSIIRSDIRHSADSENAQVYALAEKIADDILQKLRGSVATSKN